jgi:uncharacterized Zn-binding protein involved in type VI secretion
VPKAGKPAAKQNDQVVGTDTHILMVPSPGGPVPTPTPMPFTGLLDGQLASDVLCDGLPIATKGSTATNTPSHVPAAGPFQAPPANKGTVDQGSETVFANGKAVARAGDVAMTCNDPADAPQGTVVATSTVMVG